MREIILYWPYDGINVYVIGSFNNWNSRIKMIKKNNIFQVSIFIPCGIHQYKFIVDDIWCYNIMQSIIDDGFGGKNNIINVKQDDNEILIVHISDTWGNFHQIVPNGDILIHTGNFTKNGQDHELEEFNLWLQKQPHSFKLVVLGTNEIKIANQIKNPIEHCKKILTNAIILSDDFITLFGLKIYGFEWSATCINKLNCNNCDVDICISHKPPHKILDIFDCGSICILNEIKKIQPKLHLFGNICEKYGTLKQKWENNKITKFSNASSIERNSQNIVNLPLVHKIILDKDHQNHLQNLNHTNIN